MAILCQACTDSIWYGVTKFHFTRHTIGWSDIYGLSNDSPEDKKGFDASADRVGNLIKSEVEKHAISPSKIVIAGIVFQRKCE